MKVVDALIKLAIRLFSAAVVLPIVLLAGGSGPTLTLVALIGVGMAAVGGLLLLAYRLEK